jgi:hypothetical protein
MDSPNSESRLKSNTVQVAKKGFIYKVLKRISVRYNRFWENISVSVFEKITLNCLRLSNNRD